MTDRIARSHHDVLGVSTDATREEIRRAYRRLARRYHPDVNASAGADRRFRAIKDAYTGLSDPARRAADDPTADLGRAPRAPPTRPARGPPGRREI